MDQTSKLMKRRDFLRLTATGAAAFSMPLTLSANSTQAKPNVLFMAIDDLNDWTGCLGGHPDVKTPNLDKLAGRGVLFTNAHCSAPACNPSRASLMTGILPSTSGVYHNPDPWRKSPALKNAAVGMGMTPLQVLTQVELPQAFPTILAGTRIAVIVNIGTSTIGGVIGAGGLGVVIVAGLVRDNVSFVLQGAVAAAGLAFMADYLFELWTRRLSVNISRPEGEGGSRYRFGNTGQKKRRS